MSPVYTSYQEVINLIESGGLVVLPTDTIYGVVALASMPQAVKKLYSLRQRPKDKPAIILIGDSAQLEEFNVELTANRQKALEELWPGPVSIILPCPNSELEYLHRGTESLAFRVPGKTDLRDLLQQTGPLVAPSANPAGKKPATTIAEAQSYFGNQVDGYVDGGQLHGSPSRLVRLRADGTYDVLRP